MNESSSQDLVMRVFEHRRAIIRDDHLVYTSGRHGRVYVNKDGVTPYVSDMKLLANEVANAVRRHRLQIGTVVGPAVGAVALAYCVAESLSGNWSQVNAVYAEKEADDSFAFHRGFAEFVRDREILVVEDVLTTGGSVLKVVQAVRAADGNVAAVAALVNRGAVTSDDVGKVPLLISLASLSLESWPEEECPLCKEGVPVNTVVGKGREFLLRKGITPRT